MSPRQKRPPPDLREAVLSGSIPGGTRPRPPADRLARPHLDEGTFQDLERTLRRMERHRHHPAQWIRVHNEFHDALCRKSGRLRLVQQTLLMRRSVEAYPRAFMGASGGPEVPGSGPAGLLAPLRQIPLVPGREERMPVEIIPACTVFKPGHRLRLEIASSENLVDNPFWDHRALALPATNTVLEGKAGSRLVLPIIPR